MFDRMRAFMKRILPERDVFYCNTSDIKLIVRTIRGRPGKGNVTCQKKNVPSQKCVFIYSVYIEIVVKIKTKDGKLKQIATTCD